MSDGIDTAMKAGEKTGWMIERLGLPIVLNLFLMAVVWFLILQPSIDEKKTLNSERQTLLAEQLATNKILRETLIELSRSVALATDDNKKNTASIATIADSLKKIEVNTATTAKEAAEISAINQQNQDLLMQHNKQLEEIKKGKGGL